MGNQNLVHVDYAKSINKIQATYRLEHKFDALVCTYSIKLQIQVSFKLVTQRILRLQLVAISYMAVAAKTTNLQDLRHSESASDLQQCLYLTVKRKQEYWRQEPEIVLLRYCNFYPLFHISFSLLTSINIFLYHYDYLNILIVKFLRLVNRK